MHLGKEAPSEAPGLFESREMDGMIQYDEDTDTYHAYHDMTSQDQLSTSVILALSEVLDNSPVGLQSPFDNGLDPDALDALFRCESCNVTFDYCGYRVSVDSDRSVALAPATEA